MKKLKWSVRIQNGEVFIIDAPPLASDVGIIAKVHTLRDAEDIVVAHNKDIK